VTDSKSSDSGEKPKDLPIGLTGAEAVTDYLRDGYRQYGLQELQAASAIGYFTPLMHEMFNGTEAKSRLLFVVLRSLMMDDRVRWTRADLDEKFHWVKESHRNYLFLRLSNVGWLEYFRDQGIYMISDAGEALMRILSRLAHGSALAENEGAALAEIEFSQMLEFPDVGERLRFLRNRLLKHIIRAETALESESAYLILEIYQQLKSAYRWAEQTRETLDNVIIDDDDFEGWQAIRGVHDNLSRLHQLISKMQLVLQDIQRKQIDIARYGLTHLDFDDYLIHSRMDTLSLMMARHLRKIPHALLVQESNMFIEAAGVLGRERPDAATARGWDTTTVEPEHESEEPVAHETMDFVADLKAVPKKWAPITKLVSDESWEIAAYRFSLLTMMADRTAGAESAEYDPFLANMVEAEFDEAGEMATITVGDETRMMTKGQVRRPQTKKSKGSK
jgi:hypothetical protein